MDSKLTRQGVRDLSSIKVSSRPRKTLDVLPEFLQEPCLHPRYKKQTHYDGSQSCSCGKVWDYEGREIR